MKLIILAAGYATRLYPLTLLSQNHCWKSPESRCWNTCWIIATVPYIDHAYVVTNARFQITFSVGRRLSSSAHFGFTIVNDLSTDDSNRLGAIGDTYLVLDKYGIDDDIVVVVATICLAMTWRSSANFAGTLMPGAGCLMLGTWRDPEIQRD
jgi:glucose-1-phosphate thymidylyltransferase